MMAQLKMYWLPDTQIEEVTLPEGYSFSGFDPEKDISIWHNCILNGLCDGISDEQAYQNEIINFHDIVPERDIHFLDYNGEHIGTATGFVYKESNMGDMHMVGIRTDFRGRGLAKYLCYIVLKSLRERNVKFVALTTGEARVPAVKSYLKAGFLPVEYDEGMEERWRNVMEMFGIDSLQMLNEDGTPYKLLKRGE